MELVKMDIEPDFLLRAKIERYAAERNQSIDRAVCEALENFFKTRGFKNPAQPSPAATLAS